MIGSKDLDCIQCTYSTRVMIYTYINTFFNLIAKPMGFALNPEYGGEAHSGGKQVGSWKTTDSISSLIIPHSQEHRSRSRRLAHPYHRLHFRVSLCATSTESGSQKWGPSAISANPPNCQQRNTKFSRAAASGTFSSMIHWWTCPPYLGSHSRSFRAIAPFWFEPGKYFCRSSGPSPFPTRNLQPWPF